MNFWDRYGAKILTAFAALTAVILLWLVFSGLKELIPAAERGLPLIAIGGVVVLVLLLTAVTTMYSILDLTNKDQAMGLPEGSIRAVIALSLIVLFAILSIFLYQSIATGGTRLTISEMSVDQRAEFIRIHTDAREIQSTPTASKPGFFDVSYRSTNPASEDFAKQLLVLLGTLMTAITSFYLGAGTVTSAVRAGETSETSATTFTEVTPTKHSIANGKTIHLEIIGTNLDGISRVRLVRTGETPIDGTAVTPSPTKLSCDFDVGTAPAGSWSIEVAEGARPAKVAGRLEITA
jgi:hypothetical protein